MPQRDDTIEAIKRLDALLEHAVMHGDEEVKLQGADPCDTVDVIRLGG